MTIITNKIANKLHLKLSPPPSINLVGADKSSIKIQGITELDVNAHGTKVGCKALVVQTLLHPIIISLTNCKKLGLVHPEFPMPYKPQKVIAQTANISIEAESIKARLSREFKQIITCLLYTSPSPRDS